MQKFQRAYLRKLRDGVAGPTAPDEVIVADCEVPLREVLDPMLIRRAEFYAPEEYQRGLHGEARAATPGGGALGQDSKRPATPLHIVERNRRNAKKSTGPRSEAGRAKSARNARKHGLYARVRALPNEDMAAFYRIRDEYREVWKPRNQVEDDLVRDLARARTWKERFDEMIQEVLDSAICRELAWPLSTEAHLLERKAAESDSADENEANRLAERFNEIAYVAGALEAITMRGDMLARTFARAAGMSFNRGFLPFLLAQRARFEVSYGRARRELVALRKSEKASRERAEPVQQFDGPREGDRSTSTAVG